ncbi:MAG: type II secretion system secretin GspD [Archangium sp.]|nr:type II secretion system secretin GspD [Archangium sp.]
MRVILPLLLLSFIPAIANAEPRAGCAELRKTARFTVYFERVDLEKLVQTVSDATCRSFLVGENVKGKISIIGPENGKLQLDADQFYSAFLAALDVNGFTAVTQGRFTRIIEKPRARQFPVPVVQDGESFPSPNEVVTRIFHLKHAEAETLRTPLAAFVSQGGELLAVPPDVLIVTDLVANLIRIGALLETLDVEKASTDVTKLVTVKHAAADELLEKVTRALAPRAGVKSAETLTSLSDDRTNRLLFTGPSALVDRALTLVEQLDIDVPGDSRARVYRLKNADAKELAATLEAMTSGGAKQKGPAPTAGSTSGEVRISVNEALNALLIVSSAGDYRALAEVIDQLDQPVRQVFIETVIMEVNLQRDSQFSLSMHGVGGTAETPFVFGSQPEGAPSSLSLKSLAASSGLLAGVQGPALTAVSKVLGIDLSTFGFALQASQSNSDVNILSTPHILTADNKEAEIAVGQRVPFQLGANQQQLAAALASGNTSAANLTALTGSISREKVELKLTVKPHIGAGEDIRMEVNQTAEELAGTSSAAGPITSTRSQKTTVVAKNEETIVLGGIMQDREIDSISKVPVLGDIPLIGQLFRSTKKTRSKVNLLVFLTPHIIYDTNDFKRLLERKMEERKRLIEEFYGERNEIERTIDFGRKPGPMAALDRAIRRELARPENGGLGSPSDVRIEPNRESLRN